MSTLKTSNIQDTSGGNNSTPEEISQGRAKAWVNFDGDSGVGTTRAKYNVSSVTDHAAGDYTVTFTNAMPNANYCVSGGASETTSGAGYRWLGVGSGLGSNFSKTTSGVRVQVASDSGSKQDAPHVYVVIFGD